MIPRFHIGGLTSSGPNNDDEFDGWYLQLIWLGFAFEISLTRRVK